MPWPRMRTNSGNKNHESFASDTSDQSDQSDQSVEPRRVVGNVSVQYAQQYLYSSNTNISFFHSADEFEIVRQQRTQFALIFARISEDTILI